MLAAKRMAGPEIYAVHPWESENRKKGARHQLLSDDERARLTKIASIVRFKKGEEIYREGDEAEAAFNIISGVVAMHRIVGDGDNVASFLYPGDLFGLSEEGRYINAAKAATPVVAYKMPLLAVRRILDSNADIDVDVIIKLCEELREAQRHALLLAQNKATTRLAMFLDLQEHVQISRGERASEIYLPMARSNIAAYLGLTPAALSRAFGTMTLDKIIAFRDRRHVKILDRDAFNRLADNRPENG
ncbi:MAG: Crp/Fnr family transcriptional regulator [Methylovirgula sp.]